ncbi:MAG: hypothetical protein K2N22_00520 [Clostridia bacterium]|nr:hypothetical protein [Clostridia bacterium]
MNKTEIINFIKRSGYAEAAELQQRFGISYKEAREIIDQLAGDGTLVYESGVKYVCDKKLPSPLDGFEERRRELERRRAELIGIMNNEPAADDDDDEDFDLSEYEEDDDASISDFEKYFNDNFSDDDDDEDGSDGLWESEEAFDAAVKERIIKLVKSDIKMGKSGAVKKAEQWLEAVKDTSDKKMIKVYEELVEVIKNTSNYLYAQLKKQIFEG